MLEFEQQFQSFSDFNVIGVGGGGNNALTESSTTNQC